MKLPKFLNSVILVQLINFLWVSWTFMFKILLFTIFHACSRFPI